MNQLKSVYVLVFLLVFIELNSQTNADGEFEELMNTVNNLEKNEEYEEAMTLVNSAFGNWSEYEFELIKELEYLNSKLEKHSANINLWREANKKGYFFLLNKNMKKFLPYLNFSEFDSLVYNDEKLRMEALVNSRTKCELINPSNLKEDKVYPLLIILHGGGSNIYKAKQRWKIIPDIMDNYFVLFIESYRHYDSKTFGWSSKDERGYEELDSVICKIITENPIDTNSIIIGGTSAGATFALGLLNNFSISIKGMIAFCPGKPDKFNIAAKYRSAIRIFITAGEDDYYLANQKELVDYFKENEIQYKYKIIPDMGHEFPKSYISEMKEAFEFIQSN